MDKKQATIEAIHELIDRYEHMPVKQIADADCPMCKIHLDFSCGESNCRGCVMADLSGYMGCHKFKSYADLYDEIAMYREGYTHFRKIIYDQKLRNKMLKRSEFWYKYIGLIKAQPESRFTKSGWKYFEFLDYND